MRSFSSEEIIYLTQIVDASKSDDWEKMKLSNLIQSIFDRKINFKNTFPCFEMKDGESKIKEENTKYTKAIKDGYIPLSNFNSLLYYLQSNHLIFIVPYFDIEEVLIDGELTLEKKSEANDDNFFPFNKNSYLAFVKSNLSDLVCPTQELIDFVERKFITKQEKQFKITTLISIIGIAVAIAISLASIFTNRTPVINNTSTPQEIIKLKEDVNSITQKPNIVDSSKVNQSKN